MKSLNNQKKSYISHKITAVYAVIGFAWFGFTGQHNLGAELLYVLVTSIFIYILTKKLINRASFLESALGKREDELQSILDSAPFLIWYKDTENRYLYASNAAARLIGKTVEDIKGKSAYELFPQSAEKHYKEDLEVMESGRPKLGLIEQYSTVSGHKIWVEIDKMPYYDQNGNPAGIVVFARDITEQKKVEEELRQKTKEQEILLNTIPAMVFFKDRQSRYISVNKATADYIKKSTQDFVGKTDFDFYPKEHAEKYIQDDQEVISSRKPKFNIVQKISDFDGKPAWFGTYKSPHIDINGEVKGIVGISFDITDRKKVEHELREKIEENKKLLDEIVEYDKLKTAFFANISHEFKTPLNLILSTLQLLNSYLKKCNDNNCSVDKDKYISIMKQNCFRLLKLINNLIDITRIDSGFISLNLQNENIVSIIEDTTMSVVEYAHNHGIDLQFDTEIEERIVACDVDKIERIILNLLSNAVKFTRPGGSIWVNLKEEKQHIILSVKDTGIGIPTDKLNAIFERFRQVNLTLTRDHEGSGIGLSLVKSLAEMHGGTIDVKSKLGSGSEFIVRIPAETLHEENINLSNSIYTGQVELASIEFSDIY